MFFHIRIQPWANGHIYSFSQFFKNCMYSRWKHLPMTHCTISWLYYKSSFCFFSLILSYSFEIVYIQQGRSMFEEQRHNLEAETWSFCKWDNMKSTFYSTLSKFLSLCYWHLLQWFKFPPFLHLLIHSLTHFFTCLLITYYLLSTILDIRIQ